MLTVDPRLLEEFNRGVKRARDAYWWDHSPIGAEERAARKKAANRRTKARSRARLKARQEQGQLAS